MSPHSPDETARPAEPEQPEMVGHYNGHPSGIECIQIVRHMGFNLGNAIKCIWRCDLKGGEVEDLRKAAWYLQDEIDKRVREAAPPDPDTC